MFSRQDSHQYSSFKLSDIVAECENDQNNVPMMISESFDNPQLFRMINLNYC